VDGQWSSNEALSMFLLDTDVVTLLHANNEAVVRRIEQNQREEIRLTINTRIEILRGRFDRILKADTNEQLLQAQELLQISESKLNKLPTIYLDEPALHQFRSLLSRKGIQKIGRADLLIASIALAHRATLITRNLKHFKLIPQLKIANWVD
jgi:tRNA(fMet)-specific endonuclease VapC